MKWTIRLAAVAALGAAGCSGGRSNQSVPAIIIVFPPDGSTLSALDDVRPSTPRIQVDVSAKVTGVSDGATLVLTNDVDIGVGGTPLPTTAALQGGRVVFAAYTLPDGDSTLRVALQSASNAASCDGTRCAEAHIHTG